MATVFSGSPYVDATFTASVRSDIQKNIAAQLVNAGWTSVAQAAGQGPGNVGTVTITHASPAVVTWSGGVHGFLGGEKVILQTAGTLPGGLSVNTVYYVKYIDTTTFNLSSSLGGANINTTTDGSGTHTLNAESILLESATQANVTHPIRVRLKDNRGSCIQLSIENQAGTVVSANSTTSGQSLLPASSQTFRILASQYRFECFWSGAPSAGRQFLMAGMLYVPSFLTGITDHGYLFGNSANDSDSSLKSSFRTGLVLNNNDSWLAFLWNSTVYEAYNNYGNYGVGTPRAVVHIPVTAGLCGYRWANDDLQTSDILVSAGVTAAADEGKIKGQFFDMIYIADAFAADATDTFNGHNWRNLTSNNTNAPRGGVWVATS